MSILKAEPGIIFSHVSSEPKTGISNWKSYRAQLVSTTEWNNQMVHVQSLSFVQFFVTPWTEALQSPLSMGFPRQEHWSGLTFPSPGDLPTQGLNLHPLHWQVDFLPLSHHGSHQGSLCWNGRDKGYSESHGPCPRGNGYSSWYKYWPIEMLSQGCQILTFSKRH